MRHCCGTPTASSTPHKLSMSSTFPFLNPLDRADDLSSESRDCNYSKCIRRNHQQPIPAGPHVVSSAHRLFRQPAHRVSRLCQHWKTSGGAPRGPALDLVAALAMAPARTHPPLRGLLLQGGCAAPPSEHVAHAKVWRGERREGVRWARAVRGCGPQLAPPHRTRPSLSPSRRRAAPLCAAGEGLAFLVALSQRACPPPLPRPCPACLIFPPVSVRAPPWLPRQVVSPRRVHGAGVRQRWDTQRRPPPPPWWQPVRLAAPPHLQCPTTLPPAPPPALSSPTFPSSTPTPPSSPAPLPPPSHLSRCATHVCAGVSSCAAQTPPPRSNSVW